MAYKLVVFDMDGTILDTLGDLAFSTNDALARHGMPARSIDEVRRFVGNGIAKLIERAVPAGTDPATTAAVLEDFKRSYAEHAADTTHPYPGIYELIDALHEQGILCAVVSNKADFAVQQLATTYFPQRFDAVLGEQAGIAKKPARDMVDAVCTKLCIGMDETVYVGDSDVDFATARNCGCDLVLCSWGYRDLETLRALGPATIVGTTEELLDTVLA